MRDARTAAGAAGLEAIAADPGRAVVGLDFDGTLSPIVRDPAAARILPEAPEVLMRLGGLGVSVVIITGRPAAEAVEYGTAPGGPGLADVPGLVVLGQYGVERWADGRLVAPPPPPGLNRLRVELPQAVAGWTGVRIEDKGRALAVHTRTCPDPQGTLEALREPLAALAAAHDLVVEPGRYVLELRVPGVDKGHALTGYLRERSAGSVLFAGDDLGDLAAFAAVDACGLPGVKVASVSAEPTALADHADVVVEGPAGVVALLRSLAERISGGR